MSETKCSRVIRDALDWIACADDRFIDKMESSREAAITALDTMLEDRAALISACEKLAYPEAYNITQPQARHEARRLLNRLEDAPHFVGETERLRLKADG